MVAFCIQFNQTPDTFYSLTQGELSAFWEMATPKTDLTGLF